MRIRGERVKGKRTKDKPKCKIYLFCEGTTEKIYLQHFEERAYNVEIIPVDPKYTNAYGIVMFAKKYLCKEKLDLGLGDRGYCVFDSDPASNPDIKKVFQILESCKKDGLYSIFSNPSFEVWFVLHFRNAPFGMTAVQMKQCLKGLLRDRCADYSETVDIYDDILSMQEDALRRARSLHKSQKEVHDTVYSHECNPYTDIFHFIDHMEKIKREGPHYVRCSGHHGGRMRR